MTTEKKVARRKLSLLDLAAELGNVSKACLSVGYRRQPFHELGATTTKKCFELGLSMNIRRRPERGSVWRIAPPLTATHAEIDRGVDILDRALRESLDELSGQRAHR